ncbi:hypothetical protein [Streptomyces sp. NPDC053728]
MPLMAPSGDLMCRPYLTSYADRLVRHGRVVDRHRGALGHVIRAAT